MLGVLMNLCGLRPPTFVVARTAWDETGEQFTMSMVSAGRPDLQPEQQRSTWTVMVARVRLIIGWAPTADENEFQIGDWTLVLPPIVVRTPAASELYYALYHSPMLRPVMLAKFVIMQSAAIAIDLSETDHHSANCKLEAHLLQKSMAFPSRGREEQTTNKTQTRKTQTAVRRDRLKRDGVLLRKRQT